MKKFTLLSGIAALATVGAVFAAWVFDTSTGSATKDASVTIAVDTEIEDAGIPGALAATSTIEGLKFVQSGDKKTTQLIDSDGESGNVTLTYTPAGSEVADYSYDVSVAVTANKDISAYVEFGTLANKDFVIDAENGSVVIAQSAIEGLFTPKADVITNAAEAQAFITLVTGLSLTVTFTITA